MKKPLKICLAGYLGAAALSAEVKNGGLSNIENQASAGAVEGSIAPIVIKASSFELGDEGFYLDRGKWAAIRPKEHQEARVRTASPFPDGKYDLTIQAVAENDGASTYQIVVNGVEVGNHKCPLSSEPVEEGAKYHGTFRGVEIATGDVIEICAQVASVDGEGFSRARWAGLSFAAADEATMKALALSERPETLEQESKEEEGPALQQPREEDGDGAIVVSGELRQWHKVTLTLDGPFAHELDQSPNPFMDYALNVIFKHADGSEFRVPGYFAVDGNAGETSLQSGTKWRVHFAPNKIGDWSYQVSFLKGENVALFDKSDEVEEVASLHNQIGQFVISPSDKGGRDFRGRGRLSYVNQRYLQFEGDQSYFLKAGADAPETLLAFSDFDDTWSLKEKKGPVKTWSAHVADWKEGDPTWQDGKGKGLIGALNYLSQKGCNAFSFLTYNVDGDGSNVWPFVAPRKKFHYDCSKLDQWGQVLDHATAQGLYLHFKLQETEIDDLRKGHSRKNGKVPAALDEGKLGLERRLYCRELIARFGHALALNWNIGEECTLLTSEVKDMARYLHEVDPYDHHIVLHTYPSDQNKHYRPLLGFKEMSGLSLQNEWDEVHHLTKKWIKESQAAGHPWVCANDEQGPASIGVPPDPDFPGKNTEEYTIDDIRKYTLWGNLMAGGAGVEYYFGYQVAENDLRSENFRARAKSWDYCRIALDFFRNEKIPIQEMVNRNDLIGNAKDKNDKYCLAKEGELYLVYLPNGGSTEIEKISPNFSLNWFNPRNGEMGDVRAFDGRQLTAPDGEDWLAVLKAK